MQGVGEILGEQLFDVLADNFLAIGSDNFFQR